jgi:hypothetical protein
MKPVTIPLVIQLLHRPEYDGQESPRFSQFLCRRAGGSKWVLVAWCFTNVTQRQIAQIVIINTNINLDVFFLINSFKIKNGSRSRMDDGLSMLTPKITFFTFNVRNA